MNISDPSKSSVSSHANEEVSSLTMESSRLGMFFSSTSLFVFTLSVLPTLPCKHRSNGASQALSKTLEPVVLPN